jgi:hypothetical protein
MGKGRDDVSEMTSKRVSIFDVPLVSVVLPCLNEEAAIGLKKLSQKERHEVG